MSEVKSPRRGSLAYWPKKRARRIYPRVQSYPKEEKPKILGFAGYKAGMTHVILLDSNKGSNTFGQEISIPVTIIECPPLKIVGIRAYKNTVRGLKVLNEVWAKDLPKDLKRKMNVGNFKTDERLAEAEKNLEKISKIRVIVSTQPRISGVGKKTPEVFEVEVGGNNSKEMFNFAKQLLGKEVKVNDILKDGELIDVIAVTKGKGTAGPVQRFGIKIQVRHAKKKLRHVGSLGQQVPGKVRRTVAQAGQLGFQTRTELNKRILKIGENGNEITPKAGMKRYGVVKSGYIILEGSIPGSKKRLIRIRPAIRPTSAKILVPELRHVVKGE